jgi:hypothetical protein
MKRNQKQKPVEQEAVKTTIVGGRPPGSGKPVGDIPRGIEVLVKKASVDPAFKGLLLRKRSEAAKEIGLELEPSEIAMINAVPEPQLESIISKTIVFPKQRKAFLGKVAALMIVALGASTFGCSSRESSGSRDRWDENSKGVRPDRPGYYEGEERNDSEKSEDTGERKDDTDPSHVTLGHQPDKP